VGDPASAPDDRQADPDSDLPDYEEPRDLRGCLLFFLRFTGCTTLIWFIMTLAIIAVALLSLLFWR
jgi:hypothetical protein